MIIHQTAAKVAEYFGISSNVTEYRYRYGLYPVITAAHGRSSRGWIPLGPRPATVGHVRLLKKQGADSVEITYGERHADFSTDEIIQYAERPLLGGRLI